MALEIVIKQGDITTASVDAIVNAANNQFWMGSGVAGAIKAVGGEAIEKDAMSKGPVMPGEAVYSTAGKLPFAYVIHGAVMGQDLRTTDLLIRKTTVACLKIADDLKLTSLALPAFGTGVGGFPIQACANIMLKTARAFESVAKHVTRVEFWLYDDSAFAVFSQKWKLLEKEISG